MANVARRSTKTREAIMGAFAYKTVPARLVFHYFDVRPPSAAECAKEVGLVSAFEAQCVVVCGGPRLAAALARNVLEHALIDDDPISRHRPLEAQDVTVSVRRQIIGCNAAAIEDKVAVGGAQSEVPGAPKREYLAGSGAPIEQALVHIQAGSGPVCHVNSCIIE